MWVQGKCATVERLDHYLNSRVPELIRQYKSQKVRQTPYIIAEPIAKSHLIICPQYASVHDVAILQRDAYQAELNKSMTRRTVVESRISCISCRVRAS